MPRESSSSGSWRRELAKALRDKHATVGVVGLGYAGLPMLVHPHQPVFHAGGRQRQVQRRSYHPEQRGAGPHTIQCSGQDRKGDPVLKAITIQILAGVVGGGGGTSFTGTILNLPLWMLVAALFASAVTALAIGRRRRRGVRTGSWRA